MARSQATDQIGDSGVMLCQLFVERTLGWIFRRIEHRDVGIDAEVEVVLGGEPTGQMLAIQIKSGDSYFREATSNGWKYRGDYAHLRYWRDHRLTVLVVLVNLDIDLMYWAHVGPATSVVEAVKSWTVEVPSSARLTEAVAKPWSELAWAGDKLEAIFRYSKTQQSLIDVILRGGRVFLEVDEWVNKTSGRSTIKLIVEDPDADQDRESEISVIGLRGVDETELKNLFPWADAIIDDEYYELHGDEPPSEFSYYDSEIGAHATFEDEPPATVRPYTSHAGEVDSYRFELILNEVGKAFITMLEHANKMERLPPYYVFRRLAANGK